LKDNLDEEVLSAENVAHIVGQSRREVAIEFILGKVEEMEQIE
jgi:hypothetical protein